MTLSDVERTVLDLAVEDSYALSEVVSRVGDSRPDLTHKEVNELARRTVGDLLRRDLIEITRLESADGAEATLERNAAELALADDLNWREFKQWRSHVRLAATAAGQRVYYGS